VLVRCEQCGLAVSEWAARCPQCGADLSAAVVVAVDLERRRGPQRSSMMFGGGAIVALLIAAIALWQPWQPTRAGQVSLPHDLRSHAIFYAESNATRLVSADNHLRRELSSLGAAGFPERAFNLEAGLLFIHDGAAQLFVAPFDGPVIALGPATHAFPAGPAVIGLERGTLPGPVTIRLVSPAGQEIGGDAVLPTGTLALASTPRGLLLQADDLLRVWDPETATVRTTLGPFRDFLGVQGSLVAWTRNTPCSLGCPLHVTDVATGADQVIASAPGTDGYIAGGAISPNGRWLAAFFFVGAGPSPGARAALIDLRTAQVTTLEPPVRVGELIGAANWTPDSRWLIFGGLSGSLYAYRPGQRGPALPLPLPSSYTFASR
jgi:hypothetical protein